MKTYYDEYLSPIGTIYVILDETGIQRVELFEENWVKYKEKHKDVEHNADFCKEVICQLDEYFKGERKNFTCPLSVIKGTEFQRKVWSALCAIPYGEVRSYGDIAVAIENPKSVRAIGQANHANPIPLFIPCHRVIGKSGKLIGYAGCRTDIQERLLELEGYKL